MNLKSKLEPFYDNFQIHVKYLHCTLATRYVFKEELTISAPIHRQYMDHNTTELIIKSEEDPRTD